MKERFKIGAKRCSVCGVVKGLNYFYFQKKKKSDGSVKTYYNPKCKECVKSQSMKWKEKNKKSVSKSNRKYYNGNRETALVRSRKSSERGTQKKWRKSNPDKIKKYNLNRKIHKNHEINKKEWFDCRNYFNFKCAYCGIGEDEAKSQQEHCLHREHVDHEGLNDLSNCVPACRSCNASKHQREMVNSGFY